MNLNGGMVQQVLRVSRCPNAEWTCACECGQDRTCECVRARRQEAGESEKERERESEREETQERDGVPSEVV